MNYFAIFDTCTNGGSCMEMFGNVTVCSCLPEYTGPTCHSQLCLNDTCMNGGTCMEDSGSVVSCSCRGGFTGILCNENVLGCSSNPCENAATCRDEADGTFTCVCPPEWLGKTCSTNESTENYANDAVLLGTIGVLSVIILLLCGSSFAGFGLAFKFSGREFSLSTAGPHQ